MTPPSPPYPDSAGSFVPPLPQQSNTSANNWHGGRILESYDDDDEEDVDIKPVVLVPAAAAVVKGKRGGKRGGGGRRPGKNSNSSPEEDERRRLRRERNKMAAARCRKRRVDHTNMLQEVRDTIYWVTFPIREFIFSETYGTSSWTNGSTFSKIVQNPTRFKTNKCFKISLPFTRRRIPWRV